MLLTLLQSGYENVNGALSNITTSEAFLLIVIIGIAGFLVQMRLRSVFAKYSKEPLPGGMTGAEIAAKMLRDHNITNVRITHVPGSLTDHFNPATMTVNLSDEVYSGRSIAAAAVACHECGHAIQHAEGYAPLQLRSALVPVVNFSARMATWVILLGLIMTASTSSTIVCWIGIGMIAMSAVFSIVTLPVEYNASARALEWLESSRVLYGEQMEGARTSLRWAARTYLVAALSAIASVIYYIALMNGRNRD
ncbi:MAG: zinc metallopeptidase [Alistipes sp.]|nr:zinc metallopeptidase [Alistipes sp.]MBR0393998.1 zinc metallopeptidase [Alistipes sp.]